MKVPLIFLLFTDKECAFANGPKPHSEIVPKGVVQNGGDCEDDNARGIATPHRQVQAGVTHARKFEVVPTHYQIFADSDLTPRAVKFNIETVPDAREEHLSKEFKSRRDLIKTLQKSLSEAHTIKIFGYLREAKNSQRETKIEGVVSPQHIAIEALSETRNENVVHVGGNGLIMAAITAFAQHLPLMLSPDHIWVVICHAFAQHVDKNPENLRKNFVKYQGKRRLLVVTPNNFEMSNKKGPDAGASSREWEEYVFPHFSAQIRNHIGEDVHALIASGFSTTTASTQAAHEVSLMSAMKNYFSYGMRTECGVPNITLLGTKRDWIRLRARAERLGTLMTPEFSKYWMPLLLPVLDEFLASYQGQVNHGFWQSMIKFRESRDGSGISRFISGWIPILFPYLTSGYLNEILRPWNQVYFQGPTLEQFPLTMSSAPVDWDYHETVFDLEFHAGILGFTQSKETGSLSPLIG